MPLLSRVKRQFSNPLVMALYVPSMLFATMIGMFGTFLPLYVAEYDVNYGTIGLVISANALGMLFSDVPAGIVMARVGQKRAMFYGLLLITTANGLLFFTPPIILVFLFRFIGGIGFSFFGVARHAFMTDAFPPRQRGRGISLMAGTFRAGRFLGPAIGGIAAKSLGLHTLFLIGGSFSLVAALCILFFVQGSSTAPKAQTPGHSGLKDWGVVIREHYRTLFAAGGGVFMAAMTRVGWNNILPLYGADMIGLDVDQIGFVISALSIADTIMFYPAGMVMDRKGRKWAIVPSFTLQAIGVVLVSMAGSFYGLLGAGMFLGFGNGLGAGTMMTLGADLAPQEGRDAFLGTWRFIGDTGGLAAPLVIGQVADALTLPMATLVIAACGFATAGIFGAFVPETLKRKVRRKKPVAS